MGIETPGELGYRIGLELVELRVWFSRVRVRVRDRAQGSSEVGLGLGLGLGLATRFLALMPNLFLRRP